MGGRGACKSGDPYEEMYNSMEIYRTLSPQVIELKSHQMTEQKVLGMGRVRIRKGKVIRWREMGVPERGTDSEPRKVVESMLEELCQREGVRLPDGVSPHSLYELSLSRVLTFCRGNQLI